MFLANAEISRNSTEKNIHSRFGPGEKALLVKDAASDGDESRRPESVASTIGKAELPPWTVNWLPGVKE
jgi:hypothetical protein